MGEAVLELVRLLEQQEELIRRLIVLGREQMRALREDDLEGLCRVAREQEGVAERLKSLEEKRLALVGRLAAGAGAGDAAPKFLPAEEGPHEERLAELAARLRAGYTELKELNEINRRLIQQTLAYVNHVLACWGSREAVYDRRGGLEARPGAGMDAVV